MLAGCPAVRRQHSLQSNLAAGSTCQRKRRQLVPPPCAHWLRPESPNPVYNKYRTREGLQESRTRMWLDTAEPYRDEPVTILTKLRFVAYWTKYVAIPLPIKFLFWVVWGFVRSILFAFHKQWVLTTARLDVHFSTSPNPRVFAETGGKKCQFSRTIVLQRLHGNRSFWQDLVFWRNGSQRTPASSGAAASPLAAGSA